MKVAIIAAMPAELKPLVHRTFERKPTTQRNARKWTAVSGNNQFIAVCAGMGADAARRALAEAESDGPVDRIVSLGFAGALIEGSWIGSAAIASAVIDAKTGERFQLADGNRKLLLVSTTGVADVAEKRRLHQTYRAVFVDMESAAVMRLAAMRGVPVCCVKAITDGPDLRLPDFSSYLDDDGNLRLLRFLAHVLVRPSYWPSLRELRRTSLRGADSLAAAMIKLMNGPLDFAKINRIGIVDG